MIIYFNDEHPSSVNSIGDEAFSECSSLTQITIPSYVTSIGNYVFKGCSSLTQITIPSSVTSIGDEAFSECSSLTQITTFYYQDNLKNIPDVKIKKISNVEIGLGLKSF